VRVAAAIAGHFIPPRITYADWTWQFAEYASTHGLSWYLLGGVPGRAEAAALAIRDRFPSLRIVGAEHGYFDKDFLSADSQALRERINSASPDVLIVGFGMPVQEIWIDDNWDELKVPIALAGGAVFDYVAGVTPRAPKWLRSIGMEWLGRLWFEPRRLWRRYVFGLPQFVLLSVWFATVAWIERLKSALTSRKNES
jgi:N-acetylglucosaminyldiphosphoundecaprenol N-acetyl-beta-D-mannosaminyltransferase